MRSCFALGLATGAIFAASAPGHKQTVVRSDSKSGRLVRTFAGAPDSTRTSVRRASIKPEIRKLIEEKSRQHDVDPLLVESMIQVESNYDPLAISSKGAIGLMQLIPATARRFGVIDPFDPADNIEGGVKYMKYLQQLYKGDNRLALAAYNSGEGTVARYGGLAPPYAETQNYVSEVGRRYGKAKREQPEQKPLADFARPRIEQFVDAEGRIHFELR